MSVIRKFIITFNQRQSQINNNTSSPTALTPNQQNLSLNPMQLRLEWKMPHVTLADEMKFKMNNFLVKNKRFPINHRSWDLYQYPELPQSTNLIWSVKTVSQLNKPRYVLVAFQGDKNEKKNYRCFKVRLITY